jgi:hypothetical protein
MKISSWKYDNYKVGILYVNEHLRGIIIYLGYRRIILEF